jgi:hypothetical protein
MNHVIVVRADWDQEAEVWVATTSDLPGLVTEAPSIEALRRKLPGMILDLLEDEPRPIEVDLEIIARASERVREPAAA